MVEKEPSKFKMRIDDERPDFEFREGTDADKFQKIYRRISRISILISVLFGVIILAAYFDIKNNLYKVNASGSMGVQTLSKELESKFSSLSIREANLEETLKKKVEFFEKSTVSLQKSVAEAATAIKYIRSARKADNKHIEAAIAKISETSAEFTKDLDKISSDLKRVDQTLTSLSQTIKNSKNDLIKIRSDIASLKSGKADQKALEETLKDQQKVYQLALRQLTTNLENKIKSLEKKLKKLGSQGPASKKQKKTKPEKVVSSSNTEAKKTPSTVPPKETNIPKPGTIIEQNVQ